ncbi:hypothetical protein ACL03H_05065 [Saccharopolyspora sp. MS10]|uniref:hypothetical protein n=1 Tax=Saccharopolyspora sp. MS10 TaxID=3385973 RepID=UPI00399F2B17
MSGPLPPGCPQQPVSPRPVVPPGHPQAPHVHPWFTQQDSSWEGNARYALPDAGTRTPSLPGPAPKRSGRMLAGVFGCGGLLLLGIGITAGTALLPAGVGAAEAGQCVAVTDDSPENFTFETTTCGTADSDHEVIEVKRDFEPCDSESSEITKGSTTLCLMPDVVAGDCQKVPGGGLSPLGIDTKVPCGSRQANVEVLAAIDTEVGEPGCPEGTENYAVHHDPPKTFCFRSK